MLLGSALSNAVLQFASSVSKTEYSTIFLFYSFATTVSAFIVAILWMPSGSVVYGASAAIGTRSIHPDKESPSRLLYWTQLASELKSSCSASAVYWTLWCSLLWVVLDVVQTNVVILLDLSSDPSFPYGFVHAFAALLGSFTTLVVNTTRLGEEYAGCLAALCVSYFVTIAACFLWTYGMTFASVCLLYVVYTCITYAMSTMFLLWIAASVTPGVFHLFFGFAMFAAFVLESATHYLLNSLMDADVLLAIYSVAELLLVHYSMVMVSFSNPVRPAYPPVHAGESLQEDVTVVESVDERSVMSVGNSPENSEISISVSVEL